MEEAMPRKDLYHGYHFIILLPISLSLLFGKHMIQKEATSPWSIAMKSERRREEVDEEGGVDMFPARSRPRIKICTYAPVFE
jgi:hypothetical protein